jgi:uncharacterized membrane protein
VKDVQASLRSHEFTSQRLSCRDEGALLAAYTEVKRTSEQARSLESPAAHNIRAIVEVERQAAERGSIAERIGQAISDAVGTLQFVILQSVLMAGWIAWNWLAPRQWRFDPYPYGLLTFIVSLEGVFIATFVLIAQNRMSRQSDERDHLNLQISLLAEQEMTLMLRLLRRVCERLEIAPESQEQARAEQLAEETNVYELIETLREELPEGRVRGSSPRS